MRRESNLKPINEGGLYESHAKSEAYLGAIHPETQLDPWKEASRIIRLRECRYCGNVAYECYEMRVAESDETRHLVM
ncbi:hypothetical protein J6590_008043 [Homalodisca vitripennis]|nr:hypothetical protein J6590_008043 [Homalodisca vitripennis]